MNKRGKPDQARYYNAKDHPPLNEGDTVKLKPFQVGQREWKNDVVVERLDEKSYEIETADESTYRRNRIYLRNTNDLGKLSVNTTNPILLQKWIFIL